MFKNRFLKDNLVVMASTVLGGVLGYFFHFIVSRKLSVSQYGELQAISSVSVIFGFLSSALYYFIIRYTSVLASHDDRAGQAHLTAYLFRKFRLPVLSFLIIYILLLPFIKSLLHLTDYLGLVAIGISVMVILYSAIYSNALQGWKKFLAGGLIGVTVAAAKLLGGFAIASAYPTASMVSISILVSAVLGWYLLRIYSRRAWPAKKLEVKQNNWRENYFSGENFKKIFVSVLFFSLALAAASNLDIILVKNMTNSKLAGYYGALSVLGKIIMWLNLSVVAVLLPDAFSLGHAGKPASQKSVLASYGLIFMMSFLALVFYYLFSGFLVNLLFGEKYAIISQSLWLFGLMAVFLSLLTLEANLALARRDFRSTYLLGTVILILISAVHFFHADLKQVVLSVIFSFSLGWICMLALNLSHRLAYTPVLKTKS